jgi:hypothetical protein
MKLEFRHVIAYLTYDLFIQKPSGFKQILQLIPNNNLSIYDLFQQPNGYKMILYPLSILTEDEDEMGNLADWLFEQPTEHFDKIEDAEKWLELMLMGDLLDLPYRVFEKLLEKNIDVFGLIDAGIALNGLTIEP